MAKDMRPSSECLVEIEQIAIHDSDKQVRGIALLTLLRFSKLIQQPVLARFAAEFAHVNFDDIVGVLETLRGTHQGLEQSYAALGRIVKLIGPGQ